MAIRLRGVRPDYAPCGVHGARSARVGRPSVARRGNQAGNRRASATPGTAPLGVRLPRFWASFHNDHSPARWPHGIHAGERTLHRSGAAAGPGLVSDDEPPTPAGVDARPEGRRAHCDRDPFARGLYAVTEIVLFGGAGARPEMGWLVGAECRL